MAAAASRASTTTTEPGMPLRPTAPAGETGRPLIGTASPPLAIAPSIAFQSCGVDGPTCTPTSLPVRRGALDGVAVALGGEPPAPPLPPVGAPAAPEPSASAV